LETLVALKGVDAFSVAAPARSKAVGPPSQAQVSSAEGRAVTRRAGAHLLQGRPSPVKDGAASQRVERSRPGVGAFRAVAGMAAPRADPIARGWPCGRPKAGAVRSEPRGVIR